MLLVSSSKTSANELCLVKKARQTMFATISDGFYIHTHLFWLTVSFYCFTFGPTILRFFYSLSIWEWQFSSLLGPSSVKKKDNPKCRQCDRSAKKKARSASAVSVTKMCFRNAHWRCRIGGLQWSTANVPTKALLGKGKQWDWNKSSKLSKYQEFAPFFGFISGLKDEF